MKNTTRILMALLAMILCLTTFVSCGEEGTACTCQPTTGCTCDNNTTNPDPDEGNQDPGQQTPASDYINIIANDATEYQIVYGANAAEWEKATAYEFQTAIKTLTGIEIPVVTDFEDHETSRQDKEIIIGATNRTDEYYVPAKSAYQPGANEGYAMFIDGERLIMLASNQTGMYYALRDFIQQQYGYGLDELGQDVSKLPAIMEGGDTSLELHNALFFGGVFNNSFYPALGTALENFHIYYNTDNWLYSRMAHALQQAIAEATGVVVPMMHTPANEVTTEIQTDDEGNETEVEVKVPLTNFFAFGTVNNYTQSKYNVAYDSTNNSVTLQATTYQGWLGAITKITTPNTHGFVALTTAASSFAETATGDQSSAKYTYDADAIRIMFYNVMGGNNDITLAERNYLQYKMLEQYMPDVLGLQEVDAIKRFGNGDLGSYELAERLAKLGYVEAYPYDKVSNAEEGDPGAVPYTVIEKAPQLDENGKEVKDEDGNVIMVDVEKTYYTYYNQTPIFYNAETVTLLASGYKKLTDTKIGEYPDAWIDTDIDNAEELAGQSVSWLVFQSKEDDALYLVVNADLTDNLTATAKKKVSGKDVTKTIREWQMMEVLDLIKEIRTMDDGAYAKAITFVGGGIQCDGYPDYEQMISAGYHAAQDSALVVNNTNVKSTVAYAPVYDETSNHVQENANTTIDHVTDLNGQGSEDQIFVTNLTVQSLLRTFAVVVDDFTLGASDHLPIFIDYLNVEEWGPAV